MYHYGVYVNLSKKERWFIICLFPLFLATNAIGQLVYVALIILFGVWWCIITAILCFRSLVGRVLYGISQNEKVEGPWYFRWFIITFYITHYIADDKPFLTNTENCVIVCLFPLFLAMNIVGMCIICVLFVLFCSITIILHCIKVVQSALCGILCGVTPTPEVERVVVIVRPANIQETHNPVLGIRVESPPPEFTVIGIPVAAAAAAAAAE